MCVARGCRTAPAEGAQWQSHGPLLVGGVLRRGARADEYGGRGINHQAPTYTRSDRTPRAFRIFMSGLLRRIRRPGAAEETRTEATTPAPAHGSAPETPATSEDGQRLPAGIAPEDLERRGATGRRSRLRRRARFLRRARELALRDLGGLVYEARRREHDGGALVQEKVRRLAGLDEELRALDAELGAPRGESVLREPGIGGTCPRCGELHASEARFCAHCGANLAEAVREAAERARAE